MRFPSILFLLLFSGCAAAVANPPDVQPPDVMDIVRKSCQRDNENLELRRQYTWRQIDNIRRLKGSDWKTERLRAFDIFFIDGTEYRRLAEKDGKALSEKEAGEEQAKMDRELGKRKRESESDRRKRREKDAQELAEERKMRAELPAAFDWKLLGAEQVNGRPCWKVQAEPKPGYRPVAKNAKFLPKLHGTLWIDQQNYEWARVDAESLDTISAGLGMFRLGKGFRLLLEQSFINSEIWAPVSVRVKANARALFIGGNFDIDISFKDYRKYSVSSTVSGVEESNQ